ncbi:ADP-ribosyl cyclase/cyclic ADP-ribose hydrolase 1 [Macrotis lagotis]|uniref:ADP-ribosyl cyclase/cyclic ADP-ribose hydrolase 1 n=1 Tax=Macrotis lagotis TaxID=92651 RepID=UPI003D69D188
MDRDRSSQRNQNWKCLSLVLTVFLILETVVFVAVIFAHWMDHPDKQPQWKEGTTENLKEFVLGRCFSYIKLVNPELKKDCLKIWETFKDAIIFKNPCNITEQDYQPLMELIAHPTPCNNTLFWSKTKDLAHQYSKVRSNLHTLEDMLPGYMFDGLTWCGNTSSPEIYSQSCQLRSECPKNPMFMYWKMASKFFAEAACGVVHVMLNGSINQAFLKSSTFGSVEVPHLNPKKVHLMKIWVMSNIGEQPSDSCSGSSIKELQSIIEGKNIAFSCEDNYRDVQLIQCVGNPNEPACKICGTKPGKFL